MHHRQQPHFLTAIACVYVCVRHWPSLLSSDIIVLWISVCLCVTLKYLIAKSISQSTDLSVQRKLMQSQQTNPCLLSVTNLKIDYLLKSLIKLKMKIFHIVTWHKVLIILGYMYKTWFHLKLNVRYWGQGISRRLFLFFYFLVLSLLILGIYW